MNRPTFEMILDQNELYIGLKNKLDETVKQYKQQETKENMNIMINAFDKERELYKSLWKQHQEQYGVFETINEYDYIVIDNDKLPEDKKYKNNMYNRFKAGAFSFKEIKRIKEEYIEDFHNFFIDEYSFHAVEPCKNLRSGYINHVKSFGHFYIDKKNQVLLITK